MFFVIVIVALILFVLFMWGLGKVGDYIEPRKLSGWVIIPLGIVLFIGGVWAISAILSALSPR